MEQCAVPEMHIKQKQAASFQHSCSLLRISLHIAGEIRLTRLWFMNEIIQVTDSSQRDQAIFTKESQSFHTYRE